MGKESFLPVTHWASWRCLWILMRLQSFQTSPNTPSFYTFTAGACSNVRRRGSCPTLQRCVHWQRIPLFISWALLLVWSCQREISCGAATSSAALPTDSIVRRPGNKECPRLPGESGERWVVSYIIILLDYHGVRSKAQMNGSGFSRFLSYCISWHPSSQCPPLPPCGLQLLDKWAASWWDEGKGHGGKPTHMC